MPVSDLKSEVDPPNSLIIVVIEPPPTLVPPNNNAFVPDPPATTPPASTNGTLPDWLAKISALPVAPAILTILVVVSPAVPAKFRPPVLVPPVFPS